jgi:hypothetical protein
MGTDEARRSWRRVEVQRRLLRSRRPAGDHRKQSAVRGANEDQDGPTFKMLLKLNYLAELILILIVSSAALRTVPCGYGKVKYIHGQARLFVRGD